MIVLDHQDQRTGHWLSIANGLSNMAGFHLAVTCTPLASWLLMTPIEGALMRKRMKTGVGAIVSLAALALGGSAIAVATQSGSSPRSKAAVSTAAPDQAGATDTDNIQQGDQTTPDNSASGSSGSAGGQTDTSSAGGQTETGSSNDQSGTASPTEQTDTGSATEQQSSGSDGPGGHEDPSGDVEFQSQSQE